MSKLKEVAIGQHTEDDVRTAVAKLTEVWQQEQQRHCLPVPRAAKSSVRGRAPCNVYHLSLQRAKDKARDEQEGPQVAISNDVAKRSWTTSYISIVAEGGTSRAAPPTGR